MVEERGGGVLKPTRVDDSSRLRLPSELKKLPVKVYLYLCVLPPRSLHPTAQCHRGGCVAVRVCVGGRGGSFI